MSYTKGIVAGTLFLLLAACGQSARECQDYTWPSGTVWSDCHKDETLTCVGDCYKSNAAVPSRACLPSLCSYCIPATMRITVSAWHAGCFENGAHVCVCEDYFGTPTSMTFYIDTCAV